jgi:hypothetical protein
MAENIEEVAFLEVTVYETGKCVIEMMDNGQLSDYLSKALHKDEQLLALFAETYIKYSEQVNNGLMKPTSIN